MEEIKINNIEEFIKECINDATVDIDTEFCEDIGFKFKNNEETTDDIDLFTSETNRKAFKFIFPNAKI